MCTVVNTKDLCVLCINLYIVDLNLYNTNRRQTEQKAISVTSQ